MHYAGIDYHKKYSHVTIINEKGKTMTSCRLFNDSITLKNFFDSLDGQYSTVVEATRNWGAIYDLLEDIKQVDSITLAHPQKVRAIAEAKIKTDKIDALTLAQLLRVDMIPAAYVPNRETRSFKEIVRQRIFLVRMRTRLKNRIHTLLDRLHLPIPPVSDLFGKKGINFLNKLELEGIDKEILRENLKLLELFNELINDAEKEIKRLVEDDIRVKRIMSLPGFGLILSTIVALEIDDIKRFRHFSKLSSYCGLVPSTYASGGKIRHGKLIKSSNKWLKWAFVEGSWASLRSSPYCRSFYDRQKYRKGSHIAIISLARRMSEIVWHILTEERFYEERPCFTHRESVRKESASAALSKN